LHPILHDDKSPETAVGPGSQTPGAPALALDTWETTNPVSSSRQDSHDTVGAVAIPTAISPPPLPPVAPSTRLPAVSATPPSSVAAVTLTISPPPSPSPAGANPS
jgi:hypothetical protein